MSPIMKETPSKAAASALSDLELGEAKKDLGSQLGAVKEETAADIDIKIAKAVEEHKKFIKSHHVHRHKLKALEKDEPLLVENKRRFVLFPIKYHEIWEAYKRAEASFWTAEEIDLSKDLHDWNNRMNENERFLSLEFWRSSLPRMVSLTKTWWRTSQLKCKHQKRNVSMGSKL